MKGEDAARRGHEENAAAGQRAGQDANPEPPGTGGGPYPSRSSMSSSSW